MITVIKNAQIYTCNEKHPKADCIVLDDKNIICVGTEDEAKEFCGADSKIHDAHGKFLMPGIIDSHIHPGWVTKSLWHVRLPWTDNVDELLTFVKKYGENHPKSECPFLYFEYYPTSMFNEKGPDKALLDEAISDRPVLWRALMLG